MSGSPGSQTDGATQITFPAASGGSSNDYAPTVSADGSEMTFIRCNSGTSSCALYVQSPIVGGTPTLVSTAVALLQPDSVSGEASRPMIDPNDPTQALYVGTDNHIHLVSLTSPPGFAERDLSNESGIPSASSTSTRTGTRMARGSSSTGPTPCTSSTRPPDPPLPASSGVRPIRERRSNRSSPRPTRPRRRPRACNPAGNMYVWTKLGGGSNIILDMGHGVSTPAVLVDLTKNKTNNSQTAWQPVPLPAQTPEVPMAALLPGVGVSLLAGAVLLDRRRRRKQLAGNHRFT